MEAVTKTVTSYSIPLDNMEAVQTAISENRLRKPPGAGRIILDRLALFNPLRCIRGRREFDKPNRSNMRLIEQSECAGELASFFTNIRKWRYLCIVFLVQITMNFNCALYSNGIKGIAHDFDVSDQAARAGAAVFLVTYGFGCELWAPWSEELGRWVILQMSLFLVNLSQLPVALAQNFTTVMVGRAVGGLCTAGGSITLGMVADMWDKEHHQKPVAFVVFSSVAGSVFGPIVGGFVEEHLHWRWCIWIQLLFGIFVQLMHFFLVPETRSTILMDQAARRRRKEAYKRDGSKLNIWGPNEVTPFRERFSWREIGITWYRPFRMLFTEGIVAILSLLSGFADALIFMFIQSFSIVYEQWHLTPIAIGLTFISFLVAYTVAWISFIPAINRNKKRRQKCPNNERIQFESRLEWLLFTAPGLPIGLLGFAFFSRGPKYGHWAISQIFVFFCGVANYAIYMATIDYMVTAYGPYAASATGGNGFARDILAGILTVPSLPLYQNLGFLRAGLLLFGLSVPLVGSIYLIYAWGHKMRKISPFAQSLESARSKGIPIEGPFIPGDGAYGSAAGSRRASFHQLSLFTALPSDSTTPTGKSSRQKRTVAPPAPIRSPLSGKSSINLVVDQQEHPALSRPKSSDSLCSVDAGHIAAAASAAVTEADRVVSQSSALIEESYPAIKYQLPPSSSPVRSVGSQRNIGPDEASVMALPGTPVTSPKSTPGPAAPSPV